MRKLTTVELLTLITLVSIPFHEVECSVLLWVAYGLYKAFVH